MPTDIGISVRFRKTDSGHSAYRQHQRDLLGLIQHDRTLCVRHIEPIRRKAELHVLRKLDRVVSTQIKIPGRRRTIAADRTRDAAVPIDRCQVRNDRGATRNRKPFVVSIDRMRDQRVERNTGLDVEVPQNDKSLRRSTTCGSGGVSAQKNPAGVHLRRDRFVVVRLVEGRGYGSPSRQWKPGKSGKDLFGGDGDHFANSSFQCSFELASFVDAGK